MTERPALTANQLALLKWIDEGCPDGRWPDYQHKNWMRGLEMRGLAMRSAGRAWHAVITSAGRYYLQHGRYPDAPPGPPRERVRQARASGNPRPIKAAADDTTSAKPPDPTQADLPGTASLMLAQIRKPHPAIRELIDHPGRIDLPAAVRRRAHLISHSLVHEALRRGWRVTAVISTAREPLYGYGRPVRQWPSPNLFELDAGAQPVGVQFRVRTVRTAHQETAEEARRRAAGLPAWTIPSYDYQPTDTLRLFLYSDTHKIVSFEDTARQMLEDRLADILAEVEKATVRERERRDAERRRQEEAMRRAQEEQRQRKRVAAYDEWLGRLLGLQERVREHAELAAFVTELAAKIDANPDAGADLRTLLRWAQQHLRDSDPLLHPSGVEAELPDIGYAQYAQWKAALKSRPGW